MKAKIVYSTKRMTNISTHFQKNLVPNLVPNHYPKMI